MSRVVADPENSKEVEVANPPQEEEKRDRWNSRTAFILASIGSAIGLGNFLRFPFLAYRHGGVIFFIPYFIALFTIGIPMLLLELSLGQKFQKDNMRVFKSIHPRTTGIGLASVYSA